MTGFAPNFTLEELTRSATARARGLDNTPTGETLERLKRLSWGLQRVRNAMGRPLTINSGYRSPAVNKAVGGASRSSHMSGGAADISVRDMTAAQVRKLVQEAVNAGFTGFGFGTNQAGVATFLHVDLGPKRAWLYNGGRVGQWRDLLGVRDPVAWVNGLKPVK